MAWVEKRGTRFRVRLRMPDGTVTTDSSHDLRADAAIRAKEIDVEAARDTYIDPRGGRIPLTDWVPIWETTHQAGPATWAAYRSHLRLHILPALGPLPLVDIRRQHVKTLAVALGKRLSPRSVADVIMVLSMVLQEAVEDRRLPFNPCRGIRIPKGIRAERPHATAEQVAAIVARQARPSDGLLILTAAYTGIRWGELTGLTRDNVDLTTGSIHVHPDVGALHEVEGKLFLGPPKANDSVRHIRLPRFLTTLLAVHLAEQPHDIVFPGARGYHQRRSNFNRRAWAPAVAGNPQQGIPAVLPGMHFHDLRHTHKTWLIEDGIPEIAQARRLGHRLPGVRGIYSHVTEPMIATVVDALQRRWETTQPDGTSDTVRRLRVVA
ncbi:tyrosine-type recombinase/integrase [Micromonospora sp. CA-248212]|uniref:tyrosine-type recombinase/integrase n=1 Tax=Micromonospora sp. CA-248212 TaxID=3239961 RepID=UPI003D8DDB17